MLMRRASFNDLFREVNRLSRAMTEHGADFSAAGPLVNIWEDTDHVFAQVDLPGVAVEKIDVSVTEGNQLTISGERPAFTAAGSVLQRQERVSGNFTRMLTLPTVVDAEKIEATYDAGTLFLTMPKAEAAKPRKIAVKSV